MVSQTPDTAATVRDAATLILVRDPGAAPAILMGRRRSGAIFMPGKVVFPGGAVDDSDANVPLLGALAPVCRDRLAATAVGSPDRFAAAAIRELWEETGLAWADLGTFEAPHADWETFAGRGFQPKATGLTFVYRAITPPGRVRRFDARFFLADAAGLAGEANDFSGASGELTDLRWYPVQALEGLDLAPVTGAVLSFVLQRLPDLGPPPTVPLRA